MENRRKEEGPEDFQRVERGWCIGDEEFRRELLERVTMPPSPIHYGEAVQEGVEARAERGLTEELKRMGWTEKDLVARRKGHPGKVRLAAELRARTTMPLSWIAERLNMGTRGYLAWLLSHESSKDDQLELI